MQHRDLHLQGHLPAEELPVGTVVDGVVDRVRVLGRELRERKDMPPLVMLQCEHGERLRFEPTFPVAYYGSEPQYVDPQSTIRGHKTLESA